MSKKTLNLLATVSILVAGLSSCAKEHVPGFHTSDKSIILYPQVNILTKAPVPETTVPNDRTLVLSAYNTVTGSTSRNYFQGETFSNSKDGWEGGKYWPADGVLSFLAYSADGLSVTPSYGSNVSSGVTLTVPDNSSAQTDILWGYAAYQTADNAVNIQMRHAEAALAFTAKTSSSYDAASNLGGVTITGITVNDVKCSGTVSLPNSATCTWSSLDSQNNLSLPGLESGYKVPATVIDITSVPFGIGSTGLIVIPQTATSVTVTYTAHNGRDSNGNAINSVGHTAIVKLSGNWVAGKKYVYTLEFNDDMSLSTTVYEWTMSGNTPVSGTPSAAYSVSRKTSVSLPAATLSDCAVVSIDWGDGLCETFQASSSRVMRFSHSYTDAFTGDIKLIVHNGTVDFGKLSPYRYDFFTILESGRVLIEESKEGVFTVNDSGKKVNFAPGNLFWDGSGFQFEDEEYYYPTSWNPDHIAQFFWSKTASVAVAEYYSDPGRTTSDTFFAADGGAIEGWTVLSKDEWNYVLAHATAKNSSSKSTITIDGINCIVLKPDGFSGTVADSYTAAEWAAAESQYGLVALPFCGAGRGDWVENAGSYGYYWTATTDTDDAGIAYRGLISANGNGEYSFYRYGVNAVRMVKTTESPYVPETSKDLSKQDIFGNSTARHNTANCYIVRGSGSYRLPLVYGNGIKDDEVNVAAYTNFGGYNMADFVNSWGYPISSAYIDEDWEEYSGLEAIDGTQIVWMDHDNLVSDLAIENNNPNDLPCKYLSFNVNGNSGNAVIAITAAGQIVWSWHIWVYQNKLETVTYTDKNGDDFEFLNVPLGWTVYGKTLKDGTALLYQYGRKDPFPNGKYEAPETEQVLYGENTGITIADAADCLEEGIANPATFYKNNVDLFGLGLLNWFKEDENLNLWNAKQMLYNESCDEIFFFDNQKTVYDPSPVGFCIPQIGSFTPMIQDLYDGVTDINRMWDSSGLQFDTNFYLPAAGYRDSSDYGSLCGWGYGGYYWSSSAYDKKYAWCLIFHYDDMYEDSNDRANGLAVVPVPECN